MDLKSYKLKKRDEKPLPWKILPVSEPFRSTLGFFKKNTDNVYFMDFIDKSIGCSSSVIKNIILTGGISSLRGDVYEVWDKETNNLMGFTIPALVELIGAINMYKRKLKIMKESEKINPVNFKESNKTLSGEAGEIDDLRVFNDGVQSVSCWKLSFFGLMKLLVTRKIWLGVMAGNSQPPVWISVDFPFKKK